MISSSKCYRYRLHGNFIDERAIRIIKSTHRFVEYKAIMVFNTGGDYVSNM